MSRPRRTDAQPPRSRIEHTLMQCVEWSRAGRHRRVLSEIERMLPLVKDQQQLSAQLLIWKAQALLAMGCADRAEAAAAQSWGLEPSPHACHIMANALFSMGESEQSEQLLRLGWQMFSDAVHLPVQLAMMLADQDRLPEAIDMLDELPPADELPQDLQIFVFGLRANLLATIGRWAEANELLEDGLDLHPDSLLLHETHDSLNQAWLRSRTEHSLAKSWSATLELLDGVAAEVDDAIIRCASITECSRLEALAARRLWRAYVQARPSRPQAPDPWGAATILAVAELDGATLPATTMARSVGANPSTVRSALRRLRSYLDELQPEFARRSFAAHSNPRLDVEENDHHHPNRGAAVIEFPAPHQA